MNVTRVTTVLLLHEKHHSEDGWVTGRNVLVKVL